MSYTAFPNGLLPKRFKFSLAESKVTTLAEALERAQALIQASKMCVVDDFVRPENTKRGGEDKGPQADKHPRKDEERVGHFHTTPRNILMEIKSNPMPRCPRSIETLAKFKNKNKFVSIMRITGTLLLSATNSIEPFMS